MRCFSATWRSSVARLYIYVCKASCAFFYCFENIMKELSLYYLNDVYWQFAKENKNNGGFL